jgi:Zn-finger nucleic acid-binding protein
VCLDTCAGCSGIWVEDTELRQMEQWLEKARGAAVA